MELSFLFKYLPSSKTQSILTFQDPKRKEKKNRRKATQEKLTPCPRRIECPLLTFSKLHAPWVGEWITQKIGPVKEAAKLIRKVFAFPTSSYNQQRGVGSIEGRANREQQKEIKPHPNLLTSSMAPFLWFSCFVRCEGAEWMNCTFIARTSSLDCESWTWDFRLALLKCFYAIREKQQLPGTSHWQGRQKVNNHIGIGVRMHIFAQNELVLLHQGNTSRCM